MSAPSAAQPVAVLGRGDGTRLEVAASWTKVVGEFGEAVPGLGPACKALAIVLKGIADWKHNKNAALELSERVVRLCGQLLPKASELRDDARPEFAAFVKHLAAVLESAASVVAAWTQAGFWKKVGLAMSGDSVAASFRSAHDKIDAAIIELNTQAALSGLASADEIVRLQHTNQDLTAELLQDMRDLINDIAELGERVEAVTAINNAHGELLDSIFAGITGIDRHIRVSSDILTIAVKQNTDKMDKVLEILEQAKAAARTTLGRLQVSVGEMHGVASPSHRVKVVGSGDDYVDLLDIYHDLPIETPTYQILMDRTESRTALQGLVGLSNTPSSDVRFVTLAGPPGHGKSTVSAVFTTCSAAKFTAGGSHSFQRFATATKLMENHDINAAAGVVRLPILIRLNELWAWIRARTSPTNTDPGTLFDFAAERLSKPIAGDITAEELQHYCQHNPSLWVLDGLDEVPVEAMVAKAPESDGAPRRQARTEVLGKVQQLARALAKSDALLTITTRPFALDAAQRCVEDFVCESQDGSTNVEPSDERNEASRMLVIRMLRNRLIKLRPLRLSEARAIAEPFALRLCHGDEEQLQRLRIDMECNFQDGSPVADILKSPLQVHMALVQLKTRSEFSSNRWAFFLAFLKGVIAREGGKQTDYGAFVRNRKAGALLKAHADAAYDMQKTDDRISSDALMTILTKYLRDADPKELFVTVTEAIALLTDDTSAAGTSGDGQLKFVVKSLQEFLAAYHLMSGELKTTDLADLGVDDAWSNVIDFLCDLLCDTENDRWPEMSRVFELVIPRLDVLTVPTCRGAALAARIVTSMTEDTLRRSRDAQLFFWSMVRAMLPILSLDCVEAADGMRGAAEKIVLAVSLARDAEEKLMAEGTMGMLLFALKPLVSGLAPVAWWFGLELILAGCEDSSMLLKMMDRSVPTEKGALKIEHAVLFAGLYSCAPDIAERAASYEKLAGLPWWEETALLTPAVALRSGADFERYQNARFIFERMEVPSVAAFGGEGAPERVLAFSRVPFQVAQELDMIHGMMIIEEHAYHAGLAPLEEFARGKVIVHRDTPDTAKMTTLAPAWRTALSDLIERPSQRADGAGKVSWSGDEDVGYIGGW